MILKDIRMTNANNLFENFFKNDLPSWNSTTQTSNFDWDTKELEDGRQEVTLNVLGHDPRNINIQATSDKINIKSHKPKHSSALVNDVDFTLTISGNYDGTTAEAKFNNGLLILTIDKKEEKKEKTIQIKVV